ncbi:YhgE/Pip family protein [Glaciibacter superstes]|uniref:YhgE/Pip family protein n=1 Tax=Glaciibacter superstes TaxID=501023 RepID=UPI0003B55462|nr:YhgE/Pip family protein [Glaciibacter superstes]
MSSRIERLFSRTPGQRRFSFGMMIAGVIVVPLAVAGLFAGALATADQRVDTIPAIVVNNDEMVTTTAADGTEQPILAGRQLVTELTAPATDGQGSAGFDWTISNTHDAEEALAAGDAYAVLTIPSDFSSLITSLSGDAPRQANLTIRTDDAHSFIAGSAAQSVGTAMTGTFGRAITSQYLTAFYDQLGAMGGSLSTAASGATELGTGVGGLATGLDSFASGAATAASGASSFAGGVSDYADGVSTLSDGLGELSAGAEGLRGLETGLPGYAGGVQQAATGFQGLNSQLQADPALAPYAQSLNEFQAGLDALAAQGAGIGQAGGGVGAVLDGVAQSAAGADQLAANSGELVEGASGLADGVAGLSSGAAASAAGAHQLADGAGALADGLSSGAEQASALDGQDSASVAEVVAEPVGVTTTRENAIDGVGPIIGMIFMPIGLWIGALAIFLFLRPMSSMALASTASTPRLVMRSLGKAFAIAAAQAVVITGLLHGALGVAWTLLPVTLSFAVLLALVFVAVHHFLTVAFGRGGIVVSLVLLTLQLTSAGGLYPIEIVATPFQIISPFLPLTWAVQGMQAIVSGVGGANVAASAAILVAFALGCLLLSLWVVARKRGARSFSFSPARA